MELFFVAAFASVMAGVVSSAVRTRKVENRVLWKPQTKIERIHEQKLLGRWLITEITEMSESNNVSKEQVVELLNKLSVFHSSARLMSFSQNKIRETTEAASNALHFIDKIDRKYMFLLTKLVEGVVQAVLRTAGEKEHAGQLIKTMEAIGGLTGAFRKFSGNEEDVTQWKNDAKNKKPKI